MEIERFDTVRISGSTMLFVVEHIYPGVVIVTSTTRSGSEAHVVTRSSPMKHLTLVRKGNVEDDEWRESCADLGWHGSDRCYCRIKG